MPPFTAGGTAESFFDVFVEVKVAGQTFHTAGPLHMTSLIHHKPPAPGDTYINQFTQPVVLLDANGNPTGFQVLQEVHTPNPNTPWMMQVARNLTDGVEGFLLGKRFLLLDRDRKHSEAFRRILEQGGREPLRLPARSPNLNAWCERFVRSIKEECLDRMIFFGEQSLRRAIRDSTPGRAIYRAREATPRH